jgi:hypothetical protein
MAGTVKHVDLWLLVEHRGRWGRETFSAFPEPVQERLTVLKAKHPKMRVALMKQPDRTAAPLRVFWAFSGERESKLYQEDIDRHDELSIEENQVREEAADPIIAVCAHGTHDLCCAEF